MHTFNLTYDIAQSFPIIFFDGHITSDIEESLEETYHEIIDKVDSKILIFDFSKVNYINSSGISSIIRILKMQDEKGGDLIFTDLSDHIKKVMDIVGLTEHVKIFKTTEMAIKHFNIEG